MNETQQFIKVPKELFYSEFYENKELFHFAVTLLALTRFSSLQVNGITVEPGQLLTTCPFLCEKCKLTKGKVRSYLKYLCDCGFISRKSIGHKYTLITVHKTINSQKSLNRIRMLTNC